MANTKCFDVKDFCEHDGCFSKPEVIFIYENYPIQLCRGCYNDFSELLKYNKAWSRRLKTWTIESHPVPQKESEFPF